MEKILIAKMRQVFAIILPWQIAIKFRFANLASETFPLEVNIFLLFQLLYHDSITNISPKNKAIPPVIQQNINLQNQAIFVVTII